MKLTRSLVDITPFNITNSGKDKPATDKINAIPVPLPISPNAIGRPTAMPEYNGMPIKHASLNGYSLKHQLRKLNLYCVKGYQ